MKPALIYKGAPPKLPHACVIVASFHEAAQVVNNVAQQFRMSGYIDVLWPSALLRLTDRGDDFPRDVLDPPDASSKELEQRVLAQGIDSKRCCFVYLVNPRAKGTNYFGKDTAFELGYAVRSRKPIFTYQRIMDAPVIADQVEGVKTPKEIIEMVSSGRCHCGKGRRTKPIAVRGV